MKVFLGDMVPKQNLKDASQAKREEVEHSRQKGNHEQWLAGMKLQGIC